jgi:glycosyltransferase involved in cell wall biosynthesis
MKILYLNSNYRGEGTWNRCFRIARQLVKDGMEVTILSINDRQPTTKLVREEMEGVRVVLLPALTRRRDYLYYLIRPWLASREVSVQQFDLVHGFTAAEPVVFYPLKKLHQLKTRKKFPLVLDWDDWYSRGGLVEMKPLKRILRPLTEKWEETAPKWADAVTVVSAALEERAQKLGVPAEKIHRIGNGADPAPYEKLDRATCRLELGLPEKAVIALYMGNYNRAAPMAVRSFLEASGERKDTRLVCVGDISIEHHHLKEDAGLLEQIKGDERIQLAGRVSGKLVPKYLCAADVLLLPMEDTVVERARFPIRLGDYLSAERPVVASDVGQVGRIIRENDCGLLAADEPEFARRLKDLLDNPDRRRRLGLLARRTAIEKLHWKKIAAQMKELYESLG